jgi:hypothetical protein
MAYQETTALENLDTAIRWERLRIQYFQARNLDDDAFEASFQLNRWLERQADISQYINAWEKRRR